MKRFVRCTCLLLVLSMLLAIPALAAESAEPKSSSFFGGSSVYLCNFTGHRFEAWFEVTGVRTMDIIGAKKICIQRSSDGTNWTTMKTFHMDDYPHLVDDNTGMHAAGVSYTGSSGYYYRAYIQLYAKKGVNSATMNEYTSKLYVP